VTGVQTCALPIWPLPDNTRHSQQTNIHAPMGFESTISAGERPQAAHLLRSWVRIPLGAWMSVCCECCLLPGRGLCDELITRREESYRLWFVVVCDLETSRMGAPYIYDISSLRVNVHSNIIFKSFKWSNFFRLPHRNLCVFFSTPYVPVFKNKIYTNTPRFLKLWTYLFCTCVLYFLPSILLSINHINNIADISEFFIM
jgi:hypothetical protein